MLMDHAINSRVAAVNSAPPVSDRPKGLFGILLLFFVIACVFDPVDKVLSLKVWLFAGCVGVGFLQGMGRGQRFHIPASLWIYVGLFVLIPLISIAHFKLGSGLEQDEGFALFKGYILIGLALVLAGRRFDLVPMMSWVLLVLALTILLCALAVVVSPGLFGVLQDLGERTGILSVDERFYSTDFSLQQIYFVTSPMLVIPIAYFFWCMRSATSASAKNLYRILLLFCAAAMIFAGTRNNLFVAVTLPIALIAIESKNRTFAIVLAIIFSVAVVYIFQDQIIVLINPEEVSNSTKLALVDDYAGIFADPYTFIFGQGLGVYQYWYSKGRFDYISELTYFEMLRNFGIFGATAMMGLLVQPILSSFRAERSAKDRMIALAFAFYLIMCVSNPNLFSSMGVMILAAIVGKLYSDGYWNRRAVVGG